MILEQFTLSITAAGSILSLVHELLQQYPAEWETSPLPAPDAGLGLYLHSFGYLSTQQLADALAWQRNHATHWSYMPLGEILVTRGIVKPQVLACMLVFQAVNRLMHQYEPRFFGEYLLALKQIQPLRLVDALQTQISLRSEGHEAPLGELLVQQGILSRFQRDSALQAFSCSKQYLKGQVEHYIDSGSEGLIYSY